MEEDINYKNLNEDYADENLHGHGVHKVSTKKKEDNDKKKAAAVTEVDKK